MVKEFRNAHDQKIANSIAWVVMPDHFHWLVELRSDDLGNLMRKVKTKSSLAISKAEGHPFKLWQNGYHDQAFRQESELINIARYIITNPIRAGLVQRCGDYPLRDAAWL